MHANRIADGRQIYTSDSVIVDSTDNAPIAGGDRNPLVEWLQQIFNRPTTTEPPLVLEPPDNCQECS